MATYRPQEDLEGVHYHLGCTNYGIIPEGGVPQWQTIPKSQKKTSFDFYDHSKIVPQEGTIPESLKELLARTAKEYQWSPEKLAYIERGLKNQNWSAEQIALVEKTIREEKWTTKHIVELEKSFREKKNGDSIVIAQGHIPNNNKLSSGNNGAFIASHKNGPRAAEFSGDRISSGFTSRRSNGFSAGGICSMIPATASSNFVYVEVKAGCRLM